MADVVTVPCDITSESAPQALIRAALDHYGKLDIVVSNAGIIGVSPAEGIRAENVEAAVAAMTLAPARITLAALEVMRRQDHGRIVTIASCIQHAWPSYPG